VYTCEHPSAASEDSSIPKIQHNYQGRTCTSIASSEQRFGKIDYTTRENPPLEHLMGSLTLHVLPTPPRCKKYLCTPYSNELRLSMGLRNSPQLSVSTKCKTTHTERTRRHGQGTCRKVPGMREGRTRAGRSMARACKEQIRAHKGLCGRRFCRRRLRCRLCLWKHAQCTE